MKHLTLALWPLLPPDLSLFPYMKTQIRFTEISAFIFIIHNFAI
jgi:hypothetical protein